MDMENKGARTGQGIVTMSGGDGPASYFQNSSCQKSGVEGSKQLITEAIKGHLDFNHPNFANSRAINIADFGCAAGPNTFIAVENIITAVEQKHQAQHQDNNPPLEFQVFFNDQLYNDFNTLFRNLPHPRRFFASGVPGSFVDPLFPKSSLHVGHSSFALHWLSKVPEEIVDPNSPAWNKNSIHCTGFDGEVAKAYGAQYENDLTSFLNARAREIVGGGLMAIMVPGLPDGLLTSETTLGMINDLLGSCLMDMANLGLTSVEKVEAFNLPLYFPRLTELKSLIERNGCFDIPKIDTIDHLPRHSRSVPVLTSVMKASVGQLIKESFGEEVFDSVFQQFGQKLNENCFIKDGNLLDPITIFMLLKRRS